MTDLAPALRAMLHRGEPAALVTVADGRIGKTTAFARRLGKLINALTGTVVDIPTPTADQVAALDPWAAYELGRTYPQYIAIVGMSARFG